MSADGRLFVPDVARLTGLKPKTVQTYHNMATLARRRSLDGGWPPPPLLPEPDGYDYLPGRTPSGRHRTGSQAGSRSPWWTEDTIRAWLADRRDRRYRRVRVPAR